MHNGIKYRSLLEAKWAAFFTRIGWQFEYEPFEGNGYIPDFVVYGERPLAVEVKPAVSWYDLSHHTAKVSRGLEDVWASDILVVGASPVALRGNHGYLAPGLLGESMRDPQDNIVWEWARAQWFNCTLCTSSEINIFHDVQSYSGRPCGHYDGDHHLGPVVEPELERMWKRACNEVQWRGAA